MLNIFCNKLASALVGALESVVAAEKSLADAVVGVATGWSGWSSQEFAYDKR